MATKDGPTPASVTIITAKIAVDSQQAQWLINEMNKRGWECSTKEYVLFAG